MSDQECLVELVLRAEEWQQEGRSFTVQDLCPDRPDLWPTLTELLGDLSQLGRILPDGGQLFPTTAELPQQTPPPAVTPTSVCRYAILGEVGRGGMGIVYRASDPALDRELAVKVLGDRLSGTPEAKRRFLDEARITAQLQHPGIPAVHEVGELRDGRPFLAMKLIKGRTLADLLQERHDPAADRGRVLAVFEQACQAVAYAHAHHVIHRDLKPGNVMVGPFGEVQVMDWGLAKVLTAGPPADPQPAEATPAPTEIRTLRDKDGPETVAGSIIGTPAFMSPEQAAGAVGQVDERADVFGLGAILCVILTGQPPYTGTEAEVVRLLASRGKLEDAFARLDASGAEPELVALCKRCLAPDREDRPRDAGVVASRVAALRAEAEERAQRAELDRVRADAERDRSELAAIEARKRHRMQLALATALLALVVCGGLAGWWYLTQVAERELREQTRREQEVRVRDGVEQALDRLPDLYRRALWPQARAVLDQAARLLGPGADPELRARVAAARQEAALLAELDRIRLAQAESVGGQLNTAPAPPAYRKAFVEHGLDFGSGDVATLARRVTDSPISEYLLAALDDWSWLEPDPAMRGRLWAVAAAVTRQPWRTDLPAAYSDSTRLAQLLRGIPPDQLSPAMLVAASRRLELLGEDVVALLDAALARHPSDFWLHFRLGNLYLMPRRKQYWRAVGCHRAALAIRPRTGIALNKLGLALEGAGERDGAVTAFREATEASPNFPETHLNLARVLRARGEGAAADDVLRKAASRSPATAHALRRSQVKDLLEANRVEEAVAGYREALRADPQFTLAANDLFRLADAIKASGQLDKLSADLRAEGDLAPGGRLLLGCLLTTAWDPDAAADVLLPLTRSEGRLSRDGRYLLGRAFLDAGRGTEAVAAWEAVTRDNPGDEQAFLSLGNALRYKARFPEAVAAYQRAIEIRPNFAAAFGTMGRAYAEDGRLEEAIEAFRRSAGLGQKNSETHLQELTALGRRTGRLEEVLAGAAPSGPAEAWALGQLCYFRKHFAAGTRLFAAAIGKAPNLADQREVYRPDHTTTAARAGAGEGQDPADEEDRARFRKLTLEWMRRDLAHWKAQAEQGAGAKRVTARRALRYWTDLPDFAGVRDLERLAALPPDERKAWQGFWSEVDATLNPPSPKGAPR